MISINTQSSHSNTSTFEEISTTNFNNFFYFQYKHELLKDSRCRTYTQYKFQYTNEQSVGEIQSVFTQITFSCRSMFWEND